MAIIRVDENNVIVQCWHDNTMEEVAAMMGGNSDGLLEGVGVPGQIVTAEGHVVNPPLDLDVLKEQAIAEIIRRADVFTDPILSKYPAAEQGGWPKREAEARAIVAADDKAAAIAATTIIRSLAVRAGEDTDATVARAEAIIAKADQFAEISSSVEAMRTSAIATINAVTDPAAIPDTLAALEAEALALAAQFGLA